MALGDVLAVVGGHVDGVGAGRQGDRLAVGHLHAPASGQRQCAALAALVALGRHFAAVECSGKAVLVDARDGVVDGEAGRPSRDDFDLLVHLRGLSGSVVESAVETVVLQVVGGDVGLCRSRKRRCTEQ